MTPPPPTSTLFPYTTLFRSFHLPHAHDPGGARPRRAGRPRRRQLRAHPQKTGREDRKSTRLNSSHVEISYAVFCLKKKTAACAPVSTSSPEIMVRSAALLRL